ncbi:MAG: hypothetical protein P1V97_01815 [Planctomycetota bacterium]|nr:hypothetical protein [Planctomycetota bacterium]
MICKNLKDQVSEVESQFVVENPEELKLFLETNPDLCSVLLEAKSQLEIYLAPDLLTLSIELNETGSPEFFLFLGVTNSEPVGDQMKKMRAFDEEWWLQWSHNLSSRLVIDLV